MYFERVAGLVDDAAISIPFRQMAEDYRTDTGDEKQLVTTYLHMLDVRVSRRPDAAGQAEGVARAAVADQRLDDREPGAPEAPQGAGRKLPKELPTKDLATKAAKELSTKKASKKSPIRFAAGLTPGSIRASAGGCGTGGGRGGAASVPRVDEADDPLAVGPERFEQLEHQLVVAPTLTQEREHHLVAEVVVTDADGVGVTERHPLHLGHGPRPDAGDGLEAALQLGVVGPLAHAQAVGHVDTPAGPSSARRRSTPSGWKAQYGRAASRAGVGGTTRPSAAGPGAGDPYRRTSWR